MRWLIAGGGTGGHLTPALALGETARAAGEPVLFVGARRGLDARLVPEAGFELVALPVQPVVGRGLLEKLGALLALLGATVSAWRTLARFRPAVVLSVGGYASMPAVLAAFLRGTPVALLETNARPGRANRLAARIARRVFVEFDAGAAVLLGARAGERARRTGMPLRPALVAALQKSAPARRPEAPFRVFVCGGSQGAHEVNEAVIDALGGLEPGRFVFVHQTGEADRAHVEASYAERGVAATVLAFERDMASRYGWADLVVSRAGAATLAELALAGRPALLVPLTHTGGGEQLENALERERLGAARVCSPGPDLGKRLREALLALLADPDGLLEMGATAAALGRPDAAHTILAECRALAGAPEAAA